MTGGRQGQLGEETERCLTLDLGPDTVIRAAESDFVLRYSWKDRGSMNKSLVPVVLLALFASHSHATADDQHLIKFLLETGRVAPEGQGNAEVAVAFRMLVERGDPHEAGTG